ncbi:MAG: glycoside hydrolase family 130 protein [Phycisphaerae bacterium]|nr:glycoside hydrolase family 130 protein [Phycisphaerae bacterium]
MPMIRFDNNPLLTPADVKPSRPDSEVVCVFNAGAIRFGREILLLLRVAERPRPRPGELIAPMLHPDDPSEGIQILRVPEESPDVEQVDSRVFRYKGATYLTSISHLRLARSQDGRNFTVADVPAMFPACREEEFGIEDPRLTRIGDCYYINYSAISRMGISTGLAMTRDFVTYERMGIIFVPDNRDVTIFPEQVGGRYVCYHRPVSGMFGRADMWLATSPDLLRWGDHKFVAGTRPGMWDCWRIGGGAVPFKTPQGWLEIYHGVDATQRYCLGAMLADAERPERIIARSPAPILSPEAPYEREGFFGHVVFTCGAVVEPDGRVLVYYGAADACIAAAETTVEDLLANLR